ncbi:uncharacterized protein [Engystomops pustulosus]|uniref:uncharacterized protein isoform X2 n=2 Tax=Engystomops pustulosus TaxID=76066 RepID=UPI003AFAFBB9
MGRGYWKLNSFLLEEAEIRQSFEDFLQSQGDMQSPVTDVEDMNGLMRNTLSNYKPGSTRNIEGHGFRRVCLQLFGMEGDGKSSLINSCLSVVHSWPFSNEAGAGTSSEALTTARKEYKLTDTVYMMDNRGLSHMTTDERLEISAQFRNLRSTSKVVWEFELERTVDQLEDRFNNHSMDFILPVLVCSIDRTVDKNVMKKLSPYIRDAYEINGIFPIVVLTKPKLPDNEEPLRTIQELGCHHIFILDNYSTTNSARSVDTDSKVLKFLDTCLREADRGIQRKKPSNIQSQFIKQAAEQIKAEMRRQREIQEEKAGLKHHIHLNQKENQPSQTLFGSNPTQSFTFGSRN